MEAYRAAEKKKYDQHMAKLRADQAKQGASWGAGASKNKKKSAFAGFQSYDASGNEKYTREELEWLHNYHQVKFQKALSVAIHKANRAGEVPKDRNGRREFTRTLKEKIHAEVGLKTAEMGVGVRWDEQDIIRLIRMMKN